MEKVKDVVWLVFTWLGVIAIVVLALWSLPQVCARH
jgi:hypothetical protein